MAKTGKYIFLILDAEMIRAFSVDGSRVYVAEVNQQQITLPKGTSIMNQVVVTTKANEAMSVTGSFDLALGAAIILSKVLNLTLQPYRHG